MLEALTVVTVVTVGLMTGVELAVAALLNPIFNRLPQHGGVAARGVAARILGRVMPFWYITSVILGVLWSVSHWGAARGALVSWATGLLVLSVALSIVLLVPINSRVARWTEGSVPRDWRQQLRRWDRFHVLRVGVVVAAFGMFATAL